MWLTFASSAVRHINYFHNRHKDYADAPPASSLPIVLRSGGIRRAAACLVRGRAESGRRSRPANRHQADRSSAGAGGPTRQRLDVGERAPHDGGGADEPDESITLDGRLDEDVWMRAVPATNFMQQDPDNGQPATEQTEVRIVYDADKLYMGVTLFDSEPDKLIYYQMGRDGNLPADDKLQWAIDTFLDGRTAYWWEMNPLGSMADALRGANNTSNRQWDGIWDGRATRSDIGWTLEIEVPFRTMNFNPNSEAWGVNFQRTIARKNEVSLWMGWPRNQGLNRMSNAGLLTGIRDVTQGHGPRREAVPGRRRRSRFPAGATRRSRTTRRSAWTSSTTSRPA